MAAQMGGRARVYPRACGGTVVTPCQQMIPYGLSPRVRGNPPAHFTMGNSVGSIPARAGEPKEEPGSSYVVRVYPRACGGTTAQPSDRPRCAGLSPRVRGNPHVPLKRAENHGSIPARAGEPASAGSPGAKRQVYPRACGGTVTLSPSAPGSPGLSPRVRGNLRRYAGIRLKERSIPARAGEPFIAGMLVIVTSVYPRACGGTNECPDASATAAGLSPRVRGNHRRTQ